MPRGRGRLGKGKKCCYHPPPHGEVYYWDFRVTPPATILRDAEIGPILRVLRKKPRVLLTRVNLNLLTELLANNGGVISLSGNKSRLTGAARRVIFNKLRRERITIHFYGENFAKKYRRFPIVCLRNRLTNLSKWFSSKRNLFASRFKKTKKNRFTRLAFRAAEIRYDDTGTRSNRKQKKLISESKRRN